MFQAPCGPIGWNVQHQPHLDLSGAGPARLPYRTSTPWRPVFWPDLPIKKSSPRHKHTCISMHSRDTGIHQGTTKLTLDVYPVDVPPLYWPPHVPNCPLDNHNDDRFLQLCPTTCACTIGQCMQPSQLSFMRAAAWPLFRFNVVQVVAKAIQYNVVFYGQCTPFFIRPL